MDAHFVVRVLDEMYGLLGWAKVLATAQPETRGIACPFYPREPTTFTMTAEGRTSYVSIHWTDLDLARLKTIDPVPVVVGQLVTLPWDEPIWVVVGQRKVPLPPVTEAQRVVIGVPTATVGARAGMSREG